MLSHYNLALKLQKARAEISTKQVAIFFKNKLSVSLGSLNYSFVRLI